MLRIPLTLLVSCLLQAVLTMADNSSATDMNTLAPLVVSPKFTKGIAEVHVKAAKDPMLYDVTTCKDNTQCLLWPKDCTTDCQMFFSIKQTDDGKLAEIVIAGQLPKDTYMAVGLSKGDGTTESTFALYCENNDGNSTVSGFGFVEGKKGLVKSEKTSDVQTIKVNSLVNDVGLCSFTQVVVPEAGRKDHAGDFPLNQEYDVILAKGPLGEGEAPKRPFKEHTSEENAGKLNLAPMKTESTDSPTESSEATTSTTSATELPTSEEPSTSTSTSSSTSGSTSESTTTKPAALFNEDSCNDNDVICHVWKHNCTLDVLPPNCFTKFSFKKINDTTADITIYGNLLNNGSEIGKGWLAVGFSEDDKMGNDLILYCESVDGINARSGVGHNHLMNVTNATGTVEEKPRNSKLTQEDIKTIHFPIETKLERNADGHYVAYCHFQQTIAPSVSPVDKYPLNKNYTILMAKGQHRSDGSFARHYGIDRSENPRDFAFTPTATPKPPAASEQNFAQRDSILPLVAAVLTVTALVH